MKSSRVSGQVVSTAIVLRGVQAMSFLAAAATPALAFRKIAEVGQTEGEIVAGVLATVSTALFLTGLGVAMHVLARLHSGSR